MRTYVCLIGTTHAKEMDIMDRQTLTALVATNPARALEDAKDHWRTRTIDTDLALEIIAAAKEALAVTPSTEDATSTNPFTDEAIANGYHYGSSREAALISEENGTDTMTCDCGGTAWYKHTVGTFKCHSCGDLYSHRTGSWF